MDSESRLFGGLIVGQLVGTIVLLVGLFQFGLLAPVTLAGAGIILLCIAGLAWTALATEREDRAVRDADRDAGGQPRLGRGSRR